MHKLINFEILIFSLKKKFDREFRFKYLTYLLFAAAATTAIRVTSIFIAIGQQQHEIIIIRQWNSEIADKVAIWLK